MKRTNKNPAVRPVLPGKPRELLFLNKRNPTWLLRWDFFQWTQIHSSQCAGFVFARHGDPYGNRTHVTAVKGRCLNRLTNGPGSGNLIRTDDIPGMNRLLYQLSYAAMCGQRISAPPKSASSLYPLFTVLSSIYFDFLKVFLGILMLIRIHD